MPCVCLVSLHSPNSELLGVLNAVLRCPPWCWMVCPPSRRSCLPLSPFLFPFVAWCVRLPDGFVSPCSPCPLVPPSCFPLLDGVPAFSRVLSPLVSLCLPSCFPLLDDVGWCVPKGLVSPCLLIVSLLASLCWMGRPPSRGSCLPWFRFVSWGASAFPMVLSPLVSSCLPLCPFLSPCVPLCHLSPRWMVCPPSPESCLPLSPFLFPFVGWCLLPEGLVSPFLPLTPLSPLLVSLCWVVYPPSRGDKLTPLVSPCLPSWSPSGVLLGVLNAFLRWPPWC